MFHCARSVRPRGFSSLAGAAVLAVAAVVLSGCEVTESSGNNDRFGPMCPAIYDPVCAESRGQQRTFPNSCEARAQDWRIVSSGQCRAADFRDDRRDDRNRDFRNRDGRDGRDRDFRGRDDRYRDDRDTSRDRTDLRDFERPRFDNRPGRNAPVRPPVRPQPPVYQPPVNQQPVYQAPVQPIRPQQPGGACGQGVELVCGQVGSSAQMFRNRCELLNAGAIEVALRQCKGGRS